MKRNFVVSTADRFMWARCLAAYVLIADYYSPLSIVRADLDDGSLVEETPLGSSLQEDRFITLVATLSMYAALDPDSCKKTCLEQIPEAVLRAIAEMLQEQGKTADRDAVMRERDRLFEMAADILRKKHMYYLQLAATLFKGPVTTDIIEELKEQYCSDMCHMA